MMDWPSDTVKALATEERAGVGASTVPDELAPLLELDDELLPELDEPVLVPVASPRLFEPVGGELPPPPPPPQAVKDNTATEISNLAAASLNGKPLWPFALITSVLIDLPQIIRTCFPCLSLNIFIFGDLDINAIHMPLQINPKNQTVIFF